MQNSLMLKLFYALVFGVSRECHGLCDPAGRSHGQGWGTGTGWNICALGKPAPAVRVVRAHCGHALAFP
jgi:hypothetical protein